jgi:hypothetical protein
MQSLFPFCVSGNEMNNRLSDVTAVSRFFRELPILVGQHVMLHHLDY